jgi:hypothetical protein
MPERSKKNAVLYFLFSSPWLPLIFIALFALFIYAEYARLTLPRFIPLPRTLIIVNNICFLLVIALRFISRLLRLTRKFHYDAGDQPRMRTYQSDLQMCSLRSEFAAAGFCFDKSGYGEKRTLSLPATTFIYGGILLALLVGSYDNLRYFSGAFVQGLGAPTPLDDERLFSDVRKGPLVSLKSMPKLQVKKFIFDDTKWPKGAVELALYDKNNAVVAQRTVAKNGKPLAYRGLEYHLEGYFAEVPLQISTDNMHMEFEGTLKVQPLDPPQGSYTYYASFQGIRLMWDLLYDPAGKTFRLMGGKNGKNIVDGVIIIGRDTTIQMGPFVAKLSNFAQRVEIHVVRHRQLVLVYLGLGISAIGILLRLILRPQRVWLEEAPEGCRAWGVGGEVKRLLNTKD